ncbi:MAG: NACHT domain-containing protein [Alphaproteobacteria bacterium]|nr:NACHT domain-containing protein [Alphaproteobacteria bacterium]
MTDELAPDLAARLGTALDRAQNALHGYRVDQSIVAGGEQYDTSLVGDYLKKIPVSTDFTHLPALLGSDRRLPIASMYVELAVGRMSVHPVPELLEPTYTLAQALNDRSIRRRARRLPIDQALSACKERNIVILGDPGSGKTSLLKRIALEIARGQWPNWFIPLYASLRVYWQNRRQYRDAGLTLMHYLAGVIYGARSDPSVSVYRSLFMGGAYRDQRHEVHNLENLFAYLSGPERRDVVLLLDGFDEISSDPEARETLTTEIAQLGHGFSWILTSRRAGFFGGLNEDIRYEVVDLDDDGIVTLAGNWFRHQDMDDPDAKAAMVLDQVFGNERLLGMARNPFLLTLLCHLRSVSRQALPLHRADIYDRLIDRVAEHVRDRTKDSSVLDASARQFLAKFCHHLYTDRSRTPRHLFDRNDWTGFQCDQPRPDLEKQLLPSRLLDKWDIDSGYHLVHLTFHEYFVARALLDRPLVEATQKIYSPHWRVVLRFYGSMLWHAGRSEDFGALLRACLDPLDMLGVMYVEAASLLSEAGIEDSRAVLGYDLRDRLWGVWKDNRPYVAEAAANAMAIVSPDDTVDRCRIVIESEVRDRVPVDGWAALVRAAQAGNYDRVANAPLNCRAVNLLGKLRSATAKRYLFDLLVDGPQSLLGYVPGALAHINDRDIRQRIDGMLAETPLGTPLFARLCKAAEETRHGDFVPRLNGLLSNATPSEAIPILSALAQIGGEAIAVPVIDWLLRHDGDAFERLDAHTALAASGTDDAAAYFRALEGSDQPERSNPGIWGLLEMGRASAEQICDLLQHEDVDWRLSLLDHIAEKAETGGRVPTQVMPVVRSLIDDPRTRYEAINALTQMEIAGYQPDSDVPSRKLFRQILNEGPPSDITDSDPRPLVAHALGRIGDVGSVPRLLELAGDTEVGMSLRVACVGALGLIGRPRETILCGLLPLIHDREGAVANAAADAVARVDFSTLKPFGTEQHVVDALARMSAEDGVLLFPEFYVDRHGITAFWQRPEVGGAMPVFVALSLDRAAVVDRLLMQLAGRGMRPDFDRPERTNAGILCLGGDGLSPQQMEILPQILERHAQEGSRWPLVIVLLPDASAAQVPAELGHLPVQSYSPIDHSAEAVVRLVVLLRPN